MGMKRTAVLLNEEIWFPSWGAGAEGRVLLEERKSAAEDVRKHGLDEEVYIAVVEAELGVGGKVNANGRIYPPDRFATENARLNERAKERFVGAERGHPTGLIDLNNAARIVEVWVETEAGESIKLDRNEDGAFIVGESFDAPVVMAMGKLAFLRTEAGKDLWIQYRAGVQLGTSSRSYGFPVPHTLEGDSPYLAHNKEHEGRTIDIIEGQELITYDVVGDPSAGTHVRGAAAEANESNQTEPAQPAEENPVKIENLKQLRDAFPALVAQLIAEHEEANKTELVISEVDPIVAKVAQLDEAARGKLGSLLAIFTEGESTPEGDELAAKIAAKMEEQLKPLREQAEADRKRAEALQERVDAMLAAEAARQLQLDIETEIVSALEGVHRNLREHVGDHLRAAVKSGTLKTVEAVKPAADSISAFAERISKATLRARGEIVDEGDEGDGQADPNDDNEDQQTVNESAGILDPNWRPNLKNFLTT